MNTILDSICIALSVVFFWSTFVVLVGLVRCERKHPPAAAKLRFAVLVCARNEEAVIRRPVRSVLAGTYPAASRDVIVLADNCSDRTAEVAREAGAVVWEKTTPSAGKGDVLAWGVGRVLASGRYDAIAVFDADNLACDRWLDAANDALQDGETAVTGCRHASNARANVISGWYAIYWDVMNELSNRVRTNLALSGKLTGTGFAFLLSALGPEGWTTSTMVEDVEFTIQRNLAGGRIAYLSCADYADEQPERVPAMWRQLRRWATGGWQVLARYSLAWLKGMATHPSLRLFDSFFALAIGVSVAFIHLFNAVTLAVKLACGADVASSFAFFAGVFGFVFAMGWLTAVGAVALSQRKRRPSWAAVATFPVFSLILSASVVYTLVLPTRVWKPIEHKGRESDGTAAV